MRAMVTEKRKSARKSLDRVGWIAASEGAEARECRIWDVSQHGARLGFERIHELPDYFVLLLSSDGRVARRCMVVWRSSDEVGVEFMSAQAAEAPKSGRRFSTGAKGIAPARV
jgi:hypothetical protein